MNMKMTPYIFRRYIIPVLFTLVGAIGGYLYWKYVGCMTGTCPIKSDPWRMTLWGTVMGLLIGLLFQPQRKKDE